MINVCMEATIDEICNVEYGTRVVRKKDAGTIYPVYGGGGETFYLDTFNREDRVIVARFAMSETCTRRVHGKFALNDSGLTVSPKDVSVLRQDYLDFFILSLNDKIYESARGTAQKNLDVPAFRQMKVLYPSSLAKQQEIVKTLEGAFAEIDLLKANLELSDLKVSELLKAINDDVFDRNFEQVKIGDCCNLMTGGTPSRTRPEFFINGTIRWLVSGDVNTPVIYDCEGRITTEAMKSANTKILPMNSVMIALNGQGKTRGTVALLKTEATCNQSLVSMSPADPKILMSEYLYYNLKMRYQEIRKITGDDGNDRRGLNMQLIREIRIPLPPLDVQMEIISKLEAIYAEVERFRNQIAAKKDFVEKLRQSLLIDAFSCTNELATA